MGDDLKSYLDSRKIYCVKNRDGEWTVPPNHADVVNPLINWIKERLPALEPRLRALDIEDGLLRGLTLSPQDIVLLHRPDGWVISEYSCYDMLTAQQLADLIALDQVLLDALRVLNESY